MATQIKKSSPLSTEQRLRLPHYKRRIETHGALKKYFIDKIIKHDPNFPIMRSDLEQLGYEDLGELAVGAYSKQIEITLGSRKDFAHGSDKKCVISQYRNNDRKRGGWMHTYAVSGVAHKEGNLLITAYNSINKEIDHFFIPKGQADNVSLVEIVIERFSNTNKEPIWTGIPQSIERKYWNFKCISFEDMIEKDLNSTLNKIPNA